MTNATTSKRITRRSAAAVAARIVTHPSLSVEHSSDDLTIWAADLDGREVLEATADAVANALGNCATTASGMKVTVHWKAAPADLGDYNDASSRWHY